MIKAVLFDIDGVLLDSFEANFKFFHDLVTEYGYEAPKKEEFTALFHRPMRDIIIYMAKGASEEQIEEIWLAGKDGDVYYPHELVDQAAYVKETVELLSKKYLLGIVSSRTKDSIYRPPKLFALQKYFKVTIGYQDTKNHKPFPDPLILAAEKLGVLPEECVYVGDAENDIIAAKAAGMKSILYFKERLADADANFLSFQELPHIIQSL